MKTIEEYLPFQKLDTVISADGYLYVDLIEISIPGCKGSHWQHELINNSKKGSSNIRQLELQGKIKSPQYLNVLNCNSNKMKGKVVCLVSTSYKKEMSDAEKYNYIYPGTNISIKDVQKVELEILDELDRICKLKNIPYQLGGGSLLGAVRHKGFIPWDDDIDVFMKRNDYEQFISCCSKELNENYFLQTCFTDSNSIVQFAKIRKNGTIYANDIDSLSTSHTGIWIDIFPLDNVFPGTLGSYFQGLQIFLYYKIVVFSKEARINYCHSKLKKVIGRLLYLLTKIIPKQYFDSKLRKCFLMYANRKTKYITHLTNDITREVYFGYMRQADDFYDMIELDFCGKKYPVPRNYDIVLKNIYGDYMKLPQEDMRCPQHEVVKVKI